MISAGTATRSILRLNLPVLVYLVQTAACSPRRATAPVPRAYNCSLVIEERMDSSKQINFDNDSPKKTIRVLIDLFRVCIQLPKTQRTL